MILPTVLSGLGFGFLFTLHISPPPDPLESSHKLNVRQRMLSNTESYATMLSSLIIHRPPLKFCHHAHAFFFSGFISLSPPARSLLFILPPSSTVRPWQRYNADNRLYKIRPLAAVLVMPFCFSRAAVTTVQGRALDEMKYLMSGRCREYTNKTRRSLLCVCINKVLWRQNERHSTDWQS